MTRCISLWRGGMTRCISVWLYVSVISNMARWYDSVYLVITRYDNYQPAPLSAFSTEACRLLVCPWHVTFLQQRPIANTFTLTMTSHSHQRGREAVLAYVTSQVGWGVRMAWSSLFRKHFRLQTICFARGSLNLAASYCRKRQWMVWLSSMKIYYN